MGKICSLCQNDLKDSRKTYLSKGIRQFKQYALCKRCFYKHLTTRNKDMMSVEWEREEDKMNCMCCNKETTQGSVHSLGSFRVGGKSLWYNFCDECAEKEFSSFITLISLSEGNEIIRED